MANSKELKFYNSLEEIFLGTEIEGDSGYINLLKIKSNYFKIILREFKKQIEDDKVVSEAFKEELFNQLYSFFEKYFSESGSVYFVKTSNWQRVYEKVYSDIDDVSLFWKTHMLYYVKSDTLFQSLTVEEAEHKFFFDASNIENKQSNEKKEVVFSFKNKQKKIFNFDVNYSERGKKTDISAISKETEVSENVLGKAFKAFKKQNNVDFFINKDAKKFLVSQLDTFMHQVLLEERNYFTQKRLDQLKTIKKYATNIINFISQFENELVRVWNKPKFAIDSNYVVTLDKLNSDLLKKIQDHSNFKNQVNEWKELGIPFKTLNTTKLEEEHKYLPLDTKYFKDLENEILSLFSDLDNDLDGRIVHSDNYQLLNTFKNKYREKIQAIYIDPPYNTDGSPIIYVNNYRDSSWLTLMENRLSISKELLKQDGLQITAIDDFELRYLTALQDKIFGKSNHLSTITVLCTPQGRGGKKVDPTTEYYVTHCKDINSIDEILISKPPSKLEKVDYVDLLRSGGATSYALKKDTPSGKENEARPFRHYPLLVKDNIVSVITEDEFQKIYDVPKEDFNYKHLDKLEKEYTTEGYKFILPYKSNGVRSVWHREYNRVKSEVDTYIFDEKTNKIKRPGFSTENMPTLWDDSKFSNPIYGVKHLGDVLGHSRFETPKSYHTIKRFLTIGHFEKTGIYMDYFGGSGTTAEGVIRQNNEDGGTRKYIVCELGDHFNTVVIPRIKKICFSDNWKEGKALKGKGTSQFFKYYRLEQYEETLRRMEYNNSSPATLFDSTNPFENYVFFADKKFSEIINANKENLEIELDNIFKNIDLPETISNLLGFGIKSISSDFVTLSNNKKYPINLDNLSIEEKENLITLLKPLIWWGE